MLASLHIPVSTKAKYQGLLFKDSVDGAYYFDNTLAVHTFGMKFDIDVAVVTDELTVVKIARMRPNRVLFGGLGCGMIEAEAGAFSTWELQVGEQLEIKQ